MTSREEESKIKRISDWEEGDGVDENLLEKEQESYSYKEGHGPYHLLYIQQPHH